VEVDRLKERDGPTISALSLVRKDGELAMQIASILVSGVQGYVKGEAGGIYS